MAVPSSAPHHSYSPPWPDDHIVYLKQWYGKVPIRRLSKILSRREGAVHHMAWRQGLLKRRSRRGEITQERYERVMILTAVFHDIPARCMFRDLRHHETHLSTIKFGAWAALVSEGITYSSIARAAGVDHTSVMYGVKRYAEIMAQQQREAAE